MSSCFDRFTLAHVTNVNCLLIQCNREFGSDSDSDGGENDLDEESDADDNDDGEGAAE